MTFLTNLRGLGFWTWPFLVMESIDLKVTILWILLFLVSLKGIHLPLFRTFLLMSCNALIIVRLQHPKIHCRLPAFTPESASTAAFKDLRSRIWGRSVREKSWRDQSPSLFYEPAFVSPLSHGISQWFRIIKKGSKTLESSNQSIQS